MAFLRVELSTPCSPPACPETSASGANQKFTEMFSPSKTGVRARALAGKGGEAQAPPLFKSAAWEAAWGWAAACAAGAVAALKGSIAAGART